MVNYLARKFGLDDGLSLSDYATSQEMIQQAADVHSMLAGAKYSADVPAAMDALFAAGGKVDKLLAVFEQYVSASGFFGSVSTPIHPTVHTAPPPYVHPPLFRGLSYIHGFCSLLAHVSKLLSVKNGWADEGCLQTTLLGESLSHLY